MLKLITEIQKNSKKNQSHSHIKFQVFKYQISSFNIIKKST